MDSLKTVVKKWLYANKKYFTKKEKTMKKIGLKRKIVAGLAALAVLGTAVELPIMGQIVSAETPDLPAETNTSFANARELEFGVSMAGTSSKSDSSRYYKFSLNQASKLDFGIERESGNSLYIKIYDAFQTEIYSVYKGSNAFTLDSIYLNGGKYFLVINDAHSDLFSFVVNMDTMPESFVETQDSNNDMASNASMITMKKRYNGVLAQNDDIDYYRFQVPAAGQITFNITNSVSDTIKYVFYNQSLSPAYTSSLRSGYKATQPISVKKGIYYLAIAKEDVNQGVGSYTFIIDYTQKSSSNPGAKNTTVKKVTIKSVKNSSKKKMTVKWGKVSGVSGYDLWYSMDSNFKKKVTKKKLSSSVTSKTYSGLKKKKTYYVKIRAYKKVNDVKKYGKWSGKKSVVIRK